MFTISRMGPSYGILDCSKVGALMRKLTDRIAIAILAVCLGLPANVFANLALAGFNIQHLGWDNDKDYEALGVIGRQFDFIAVQEAMNSQGVARKVEALEAQTDESWSAIYSHPIGRGSYREKYAFVWRDSALEYVDGAVVYIDERASFAREPFSARFRSRHTGVEFAAANIHVLFGASVSDRAPEIRYLARYWEWLASVYEDTPRILFGDFNLNPGHEAWEPIKAQAEKLIQGGGTTISPIDGRFPNNYDNIIVGQGTALEIRESGIYHFPRTRGITHEQARDHVSDHVPVFVLMGEAMLRGDPDFEFHPGGLGELSCIDLNTAMTFDLERLMHIGEARAGEIIEGRPWEGVGSLGRIQGIGPARIGDIEEQGLVCE